MKTEGSVNAAGCSVGLQCLFLDHQFVFFAFVIQQITIPVFNGELHWGVDRQIEWFLILLDHSSADDPYVFSIIDCV